MKTNFSLYKIDNETNFGFCPTEYSKFKFGDDSLAEKFGTELANAFIEEVLKKIVINEQIVVIPSPYSFIPTATFAMKNYFVFGINRWLASNNLPIVQTAKIHRTITYKDDYGALNADERMALIGNDGFYVDKIFLENKILIFLDDIKITGSHEKMITKMLDDFGINNDIYLLYFAELINKSIHPKIENHLNYYFVKSLLEVDNIVKSDTFTFNTRVVKYILNAGENDFIFFINDKSIKFLKSLYNLSVGNGYHNIDVYNKNLKILENKI